MSTKTYVLLDSLNCDAPIYQRVVGDQRVKITKPPFYPIYLRVTFQDKNGVSRTIRYKENAVNGEGKSVIDQREQIDKLKIEANEPFTQNERRDRLFKNGFLVTKKMVLQDYLEAYPGMEGFDGNCDDVQSPIFKLLDKEAEAETKNMDLKLRVKAAYKVVNLELEEAQAMLIRLNGSFFETPNDVNECQNMLMDFVDDAEEGGLLAVLKDEKDTNIDDQTTVLIGKLINQGTLSFDAVEGKISKLGKDDKWIVVRDMSAEYTMDERKRLFSDFLNTEDGKALKNDLQSDLKKSGENESEKAKKRGRPVGV